ncbi:hypothetical protein HRI_003174800 [Hibiscus trionum]|uniref:glycerophosphodiester phosphodiesterase n=1 Tax=Hibiscus trionum TaxID=183268 RepID=A0A9W7IEY6_HIBTR|nr:hypothetical protein HRI_003174800 [Hibiscus trionum]
MALPRVEQKFSMKCVLQRSQFMSALRNEFVALPFDFFADPTRELATYVAALEADEIVTKFPETASKYMRSPCVDLNGEIAALPAEPCALLKQAASKALALPPPANPPTPRFWLQMLLTLHYRQSPIYHHLQLHWVPLVYLQLI